MFGGGGAQTVIGVAFLEAEGPKTAVGVAFLEVEGPKMQ